MLDTESGDGKMYTFIIKDEILPPSEGGREQASISWEYDFRVGGCGDGGDENEFGREKEEKKVWIPWSELKATYRGREKKDAAPIDLSHVRRFSLMMRRYYIQLLSGEIYYSQRADDFQNASFFGTQEGEFSLVLKSISAVQNPGQEENEPRASREAFPSPYHDDVGFDQKERPIDQRRDGDDQRKTGLLSWLSAMCVVS